MLKGIKFEKSKYPIFKIAFWVLILASFLTIAIIVKKNFHILNIKDFGGTTKPITVNVKFKNKINENYYVCFDDYCKSLTNNSLPDASRNVINSYSVIFDGSDEAITKKSIKNVYFAHSSKNKNIKDNIDSIYLYIGNEKRCYNFSDIEKLETKIVSILLDESSEKAEYKIYKFENSSNNLSLIHKTGIIILSFVFNWIYFIVPYCWLMVAILIFIFNKDAFNMPLAKKDTILFNIAISLIALFTIFYFTMPKLKNSEDDLFLFVLNDSKNYPNYEIHVLTNKKDAVINNKDINLHYVELKEKELLKGVRKSDYTKKDKKVIIYYDTNTADVELLMLKNPLLHIYKTNYSLIAKAIYN